MQTVQNMKSMTIASEKRVKEIEIERGKGKHIKRKKKSTFGKTRIRTFFFNFSKKFLVCPSA